MKAFRIAVAATCLVACQLIVGIEDEEGVPRATDGGIDGDAPAVSDAGDPCIKRRPPARPANAPGTGPARFYAVRRFDVRPRDTAPIGYDLDDRCTGDPSSTTSAPPPCSGTADASDDPGGLDNAFGRILDDFAGTSPDVAGETFTKSVERGIFTLVVQVTGYNGEADDSDVEVAIITSNNLASVGCGDAGDTGDGGDTSDAGAVLAPRWDGCDRWDYVTGTTIAPQLQIATATIPGYVSKGVLVAQGNAARDVGLGATTIRLHAPLVTATITTNDAGVPVLRDGVITGRVTAQNLLDFAVRLEVLGSPLCESRALVDQAVEAVCAARDVPVDPADDGRTPPARCAALSFAFGFEAEPAGIGGERAPRPTGCDGFTAQCAD